MIQLSLALNPSLDEEIVTVRFPLPGEKSKFPSIKEASEEELAAVPGIDQSMARRVFEYFHTD